MGRRRSPASQAANSRPNIAAFRSENNVYSGCVVFFPRRLPMTDGQIQAKAIICAALIQSRTFDSDALGSANKSISDHKLTHLMALPGRIYEALFGGQPKIPGEAHD